VQLLIDRNAAAGALVEDRGRRASSSAAARTRPDDYVPGVADVQVGDLVVTSGIDGIYPKGFAIGRVVSVGRGSGIYLVIRVRPRWTSCGWRRCWSADAASAGTSEGLP